MTPTVTIPAADRPVRTAGAVLATAGALALVGAGLALGGIAAGHERPSIAREAPASGAWDATASFGPVSVQRVERFAGAPHRGHGGTSVRSDRIRVSLTLTNRGRSTVAFSPGQLRLRLDGVGTTVPATRPNPPPGSIAPGQTLRQRLTFVVPVPGPTFTLVFDDLGRPTPLPIGLGNFPVQSKD